MHPHWRFTGVEPSAKILELASTTLGLLASPVDPLQGYIDDALTGPSVP